LKKNREHPNLPQKPVRVRTGVFCDVKAFLGILRGKDFDCVFADYGALNYWLLIAFLCDL